MTGKHSLSTYHAQGHSRLVQGGAGQGGRGASAPVCQALGVTTKCEVIHIIVTLTPHTVC